MLKYTFLKLYFVIMILFLEQIECHRYNPYLVSAQKCHLKDKKF